MGTREDFFRLQTSLDEMLSKLSEATTKLAAIKNHLSTAKDATTKSAVLSSSGSPIAFTPNFEANSEIFRVAVSEVSQVLALACADIGHVEEATQQIMVGVTTQIEPDASKPSATQPITRPSRLLALSDAIAGLDQALQRRHRS